MRYIFLIILIAGSFCVNAQNNNHKKSIYQIDTTHFKVTPNGFFYHKDSGSRYELFKIEINSSWFSQIKPGSDTMEINPNAKYYHFGMGQAAFRIRYIKIGNTTIKLND